jgi:hypothetical protein
VNTSRINLVLLKSPPLYQPYVLDDTVSSVGRQLDRAGFETAFSFNRINPGCVNILFGLQMPHTPPLEQIRQAASPRNTIIFNTEQLGGESHWISDEYLSLLGDYVTFDYNIHNLSRLRDLHRDARCIEFPLIPDDRFNYDFEHDRKGISINFDLAFYGSTGLGDRVAKLHKIAGKHLRIKTFSGAYGQRLSPQLLDCAAVLNIHGFSSAIFETVRCLRPAALGIPIISEVSCHSEIASWKDSGVIFLAEESFADDVAACANDRNRLLASSRRLKAFVDAPEWPSIAHAAMHKAITLLKGS